MIQGTFVYMLTLGRDWLTTEILKKKYHTNWFGVLSVPLTEWTTKKP